MSTSPRTPDTAPEADAERNRPAVREESGDGGPAPAPAASEAEPGSPPDGALGAPGALRALLPVLGAHRAMVVRTVCAALLGQASLVALVALAAHTVGTAVLERTAPGPGALAALVGLVLVRAAATWWEMDLSHDLAYRVLAELRMRVFDGLARSAPARIAGRRSGDLASAAMADVEALEFFYAHAVAQLVATGAVFGGGAVVLGAVDPWLPVAVLPVAALLALGPLLEGRESAVRGARTRRAAAELSAEAVESVDGLPELLAFGALQARRARLRAFGDRLGRAQRAERSWEADAAAVRDVLVAAAVVAVVAVAARQVEGAWAPAAMALALGVLAPVADSSAALGRAGGLRAAAARVGAAVHAPAGAPEPKSPRPLPNGPLGIRMHGVRFDYGGARVLDGLDLSVRPGETLALVGASGAGKSTCAHLLARFWDPGEGSVELVAQDGERVDVREVAERELRGAVAVVGQETPLFHGTLSENLRIAAPDATDERIAAVAAATGVDRIADALPDRYETAVGERGTTLSGGQRARVALARALLTGPRILVLDETTARLDGVAEAELASGLPPCTKIVIAHRAATVRRADRIAVLESGRIAQEGVWDELSGVAGPFTRVLLRE